MGQFWVKTIAISGSILGDRQHGVLESAGDMPVAVLNHNTTTAYLLSAKAYEALLEKLDDVSLINLVNSRKGGKTVKVKLEDL